VRNVRFSFEVSRCGGAGTAVRARSAKQLAWLRGGLAGGACGCTASEARANNSFDRGDWREGEVAVTGLWPFIARRWLKRWPMRSTSKAGHGSVPALDRVQTRSLGGLSTEPSPSLTASGVRSGGFLLACVRPIRRSGLCGTRPRRVLDGS
jgi:hypothetical protein